MRRTSESDDATASRREVKAGTEGAPAKPVVGEQLECFTVERDDDADRLDRMAARRLSVCRSCSRRRVQQWIADGRVAVNGEVVTRAARRVAAGDEVVVQLPRMRSPRKRPEPEPLPLDILFEDEWLLAVSKPAGMVMHPTAGYVSGTLLNALLWRAGSWGGDRPDPGLLHRLDRDTSGVVLVAKDKTTLTKLARAMNANQIRKDYVAIVYGTMPTPKDRIALGLERDPERPTRMRAQAGIGREAVTLVEEVASSTSPEGALSVLRCTLVTGRMHQIRAHLEARGWPIVGDPVYGGAVPRAVLQTHPVGAACRALGRQALHAHRLRLLHPVTAAPLEIVAPLPLELRSLVELVSWEVRSFELTGLAWPLP